MSTRSTVSAAIVAGAVATALVPVMWAYDGWADVTYMSGEVKDPGRTLPRTLILGTLLIILIYISINAAYLYMVPVSEMAGQRLIAATAAERIPVLGAIAVLVAATVVLDASGGEAR